MTDQFLAQMGLSYTTNYIYADLLSQLITDQKYSFEEILEDLFRGNVQLKPVGDSMDMLTDGIEKLSHEVDSKYKLKQFSKEEIELLMELLDQKDKNSALLSKIERFYNPEEDTMEMVEPYQRAEMIVEYFLEELRQNQFPSIDDIVSIRQELAQTREEVFAYYDTIFPVEEESQDE